MCYTTGMHETLSTETEKVQLERDIDITTARVYHQRRIMDTLDHLMSLATALHSAIATCREHEKDRLTLMRRDMDRADRAYTTFLANAKDNG